MEKLETFTEVLLSLKDKEVLTTNKKDRYILKKDKIYVYREGTSFVCRTQVKMIPLYKA